MASNTTKIALRKPAGTDAVNVTFDIADNMDKIDARLGDKKRYFKTDGNLVVTATTAAVPLGGAGSTLTLLTVKAVVGDWVGVEVQGLWDTTAIAGYMDAWSFVAGACVNSWSGNSVAVPVSGHSGMPGWVGQISVVSPPAGGTIKQVVAGDLDASGFLNIVLSGFVSSGSKFLYGTAAIPFMYHIINHGNP